MTKLNQIKAIAQNLEQHPETLRMRKLVYALCYNTWENDPHIISQISWNKLIQQLIEPHKNQDSLRIALYALANTLNKKDEYKILANIILNEIEIIYQPNQNHQIVQPEPAIMKQKLSQNRFKLRIDIMRYTNPMRAKILLYSSLYKIFDHDNYEDWSSIRNQGLDNLLMQSFQQYPQIKKLEKLLYQTAQQLTQAEEYHQVAGAIIQCVKSCYPNGELPVIKNQTSAIASEITKTNPVNLYPEYQIDPYDETLEDNGDDDMKSEPLETCQLIPNPISNKN